MSLCSACTLSPRVTSVDVSRVPEHMLERIAHPVALGPPYTVESLLIVVGQYDDKLELANDRFDMIRHIQTGAVITTAP